MDLKLKLDKNHLLVFHEARKRRIFVGDLRYIEKTERYEFLYSENNVNLKNAIPVGKELDLFNLKHVSKKNELFPSLLDRIPLRNNPAYKDYCESQGVSTEESNLIVLLGSIGKKGPSSFIFEPVYFCETLGAGFVELRNHLAISQYDFSAAFDLNLVTLRKIESGESSDKNTLKLLQVYLSFPEVALWQLRQTGGRIHYAARSRLVNYFLARSAM